MSRNATVLMTCTSCHDAHASEQHDLDLLRARDDNTACTPCHSEDEYTDPRQHVGEVTGDSHAAVEDARLVCVTCHMVQTALSGARTPGLLDIQPGAAPELRYYHGDLASHRFSVTRRDHYQQQPVAATLECGACHGSFFDNP
jgi:predicted CXXCH cytochrome family protein